MREDLMSTFKYISDRMIDSAATLLDSWTSQVNSAEALFYTSTVQNNSTVHNNTAASLEERSAQMWSFITVHTVISTPTQNHGWSMH